MTATVAWPVFETAVVGRDLVAERTMAFRFAKPAASEALEFKAPDPGDYPFVCTLHPGMRGTLVAEAG